MRHSKSIINNWFFYYICSNLFSSFSKVSTLYSNLFKNLDFSIENFDRLQPVITSIGNDYLKLYSSVTSYSLKCDRAKKWGNFGWSVLCDDINLAEIDNSAFNEESADDCVLRLISPDYLNCLKNKTLDEAIDITEFYTFGTPMWSLFNLTGGDTFLPQGVDVDGGFLLLKFLLQLHEGLFH